MPLVFVNGLSGAGKSTVCRELLARGHTAYDLDGDGFKRWYRNADGVRLSDQPAWLATSVEWREEHCLKIDRLRVEALARAAADSSELVFLCGSAPNEGEVWDLFDVVVHLSAADEVLAHRLSTRTDNDYGKDPRELAAILDWNLTVTERNAAYGAHVVDAGQPLPQVVSDVLRHAASGSPAD